MSSRCYRSCVARDDLWWSKIDDGCTMTSAERDTGFVRADRKALAASDFHGRSKWLLRLWRRLRELLMRARWPPGQGHVLLLHCDLRRHRATCGSARGVLVKDHTVIVPDLARHGPVVASGWRIRKDRPGSRPRRHPGRSRSVTSVLARHPRYRQHGGLCPRGAVSHHGSTDGSSWMRRCPGSATGTSS